MGPHRSRASGFGMEETRSWRRSSLVILDDRPPVPRRPSAGRPSAPSAVPNVPHQQRPKDLLLKQLFEMQADGVLTACDCAAAIPSPRAMVRDRAPRPQPPAGAASADDGSGEPPGAAPGAAAATAEGAGLVAAVVGGSASGASAGVEESGRGTISWTHCDADETEALAIALREAASSEGGHRRDLGLDSTPAGRLRSALSRCEGELELLQALILEDGGSACGLPHLREPHRTRLNMQTFSIEEARSDFCASHLNQNLRQCISNLDRAAASPRGKSGTAAAAAQPAGAVARRAVPFPGTERPPSSIGVEAPRMSPAMKTFTD